MPYIYDPTTGFSGVVPNAGSNTGSLDQILAVMSSPSYSPSGMTEAQIDQARAGVQAPSIRPPPTAAPTPAPVYGSRIDDILAQMRARTEAQQGINATPLTPLDQLRQLNSQIASGTQFGGSYGQLLNNPQSTSLLQQRLGEAAVTQALRSQFGPGANITPFPYQPFGSTGGEGHTGSGSRGGVHSGAEGAPNTGIGPNTGGTFGGMTAAEAIAAGFGALAGEGLTPGFNASASHPASNLGGEIGIGGLGLSAALSAAAGLHGGLNPASPLGQSQAEALDSAMTVSGVLSGVQSINVGTTPDGQTISVNPSTGVVSVGGEAIGVAGGFGDSTGGFGGGGGVIGGGGGYGDTGVGGIGLGGVSDSSSNAGIGGPAGTGVTGGAGDAGQGTGGVGEGDQFGNQYVVGGRGPPDSKRVGLRVSPGELITVTPPGDPKDRALGDILRIMAMRRGG